MLITKPVESFPNLQVRVMQLLSEQANSSASSAQFDLDLDRPNLVQDGVVTAANNAIEFLNLVSASVPDGDVYLFESSGKLVGENQPKSARQ